MKAALVLPTWGWATGLRPGLTDLIALNVGLQAGLISQPLFTILVLMALLTMLTGAPFLCRQL